MGTAESDRRARPWVERPLPLFWLFMAVFTLVAWLGSWNWHWMWIGTPGGVLGLAGLDRAGVWWGKRRLAAVAAATPPARLELKAPDPARGQCPVCSLSDLDELAADDVFAAEIDASCVRVVPYGPHRAHYACAATVPYVDPTPRKPVPALATGEQVRHALIGDKPNLCRCRECERSRPVRSGRVSIDTDRFISELGKLRQSVTAEPPIQVWAHCKSYERVWPAPDTRAAEQMVREHAATCAKRRHDRG